ncbi:hypothetical protein AAFX91_41530 [Bradyrhizobium sp. 31Argb]|uniref:hypothetical protein n=1 Tax=Bradyrhizobium sp. 31Argb TaxID=3141247 RepID=UPI003748CD32
MRELYLRGVKAETILSDVVCEDVISIQDAVIVPATLNELLLKRLLEVKDDVEQTNGLLFSFLARRASETVLRTFVGAHPDVFERRMKVYYYQSAYQPKVQLYARAHSLGILPEEFRSTMVASLESDIFYGLDTSILNEEEVLSLFTPKQLMALPRRVKDELLPAIEERIEQIAEEADLEIEPRDNFDQISSSLSELEAFFEGDDDGANAYENVSACLDVAVDQVKDRKEAEERRAARDDWNWEEYVPSKSTSGPPARTSSVPPASPSLPRSMFSDVAE